MRHLAALLSFLVLPMLPERYRRTWPWHPPLSPGALGVISAWGHTVLSAVIGVSCMIPYVNAYGEKISEAMMDKGDVGLLTWYGILPYFSFLFTPVGIFCGVYLADSGLRTIHVLATGTPMGSLFFSLPLFLWDRASAFAAERRRSMRFGPADAPPRLKQAGVGLLVCCTRPRAEWHSKLTYSYGGKFYRLDSFGEGTQDGRPCFEYRLRPWEWAQGTVRSVVQLDPPTSPPGG